MNWEWMNHIDVLCSRWNECIFLRTMFAGYFTVAATTETVAGGVIRINFKQHYCKYRSEGFLHRTRWQRWWFWWRLCAITVRFLWRIWNLAKTDYSTVLWLDLESIIRFAAYNTNGYQQSLFFFLLCFVHSYIHSFVHSLAFVNILLLVVVVNTRQWRRHTVVCVSF